jgi:isocitrate dehydrogenase
MIESEAKIIDELNSAQGPSMDVGGYYKPDVEKASAAMRPSATLNAIIAAV